MNKIKTTIGAAALVVSLSACTPWEVQQWQAWRAVDPVAADAFAESLPDEPPPGVWDELAQCESNGDWHINTGNGYYGGVQFSLSTWRAVGGTGYPHEHSRAEQIYRAEILLAQAGWGQWPTCSRAIGVR